MNLYRGAGGQGRNHTALSFVKMKTFLLLLVTTLASASKEAYAPAKFVSPLPYSIQPRQDVVVSPENQRTFYPFTSGPEVELEGEVVQTGDWYKVDPAPRGLFS